MRLELRVTSYKDNPAEVTLVGSFDECDGTIGRAKGNDLVLPDPSRYISSHHATIEYRHGAYSILDTSANGICINDPSRRIGQGNSVPLNDGDRLFIGDYEVQISLHGAAATRTDANSMSGAPPGHEKGPTATELIASLDDGPPSSAGGRDPFDVDQDFPSDDIFDDLPGHGVEGGSGAQGGEWHRESEALSTDQGSASDHVPITQQAFTTGNAIPDNWDDTETSPAQAGSESPPGLIPENWDDPAVEQEHRTRRPPPPSPKPAHRKSAKHARRAKGSTAPTRPAPPKIEEPAHTPAPAPRARPTAPRAPSAPERVDRAALDVLLKGLGYSQLEIPDAAVPIVLELVGRLLRESIEGTMQALRGRASIRQEMRMDLTAIRPSENNPLKFSATVDEALTHFLAPRVRGYLPPVEAVREAYEDLKIHQVATVAGMEAAMKLVLKRFNPTTLEQRIAKNNVLDTMLPMKRKARMWELFTELYAEIAKEAEADFSAVFGQAFIRAYDRHVQQLQHAKKNAKSSR